ncbi:hypothetical protein, partial [Vibrio harveyi]
LLILFALMIFSSNTDRSKIAQSVIYPHSTGRTSWHLNKSKSQSLPKPLFIHPAQLEILLVTS